MIFKYAPCLLGRNFFFKHQPRLWLIQIIPPPPPRAPSQQQMSEHKAEHLLEGGTTFLRPFLYWTHTSLGCDPVQATSPIQPATCLQGPMDLISGIFPKATEGSPRTSRLSVPTPWGVQLSPRLSVSTLRWQLSVGTGEATSSFYPKESFIHSSISFSLGRNSRWMKMDWTMAGLVEFRYVHLSPIKGTHSFIHSSTDSFTPMQ